MPCGRATSSSRVGVPRIRLMYLHMRFTPSTKRHKRKGGNSYIYGETQRTFDGDKLCSINHAVTFSTDSAFAGSRGPSFFINHPLSRRVKNHPHSTVAAPVKAVNETTTRMGERISINLRSTSAPVIIATGRNTTPATTLATKPFTQRP